MIDFTVKTYIRLLEALRSEGFYFQTFEEFVTKPGKKVVVLRHDVDKCPQNALDFAKIESEMDIKSSYYFRMVNNKYDASVIIMISELEHEIGYHYETMDTCKGDIDKAYELFSYNLQKLRELAPVTTVCMHGSPLSKYDNKKLWDRYDYRELGIIGEPYFDVDYNDALYLTDTGRRWNNKDTSIRDKVESGYEFDLKSTSDLIDLINSGGMPDKVIINTHPQRWNDELFPWIGELVMQNSKNIVKGIIVKKFSKKGYRI